jgi:hypothetical protein
VGVGGDLGDGHGVTSEQRRQYFGVGGARRGRLPGDEQVGGDVHAQGRLVAVVAVPAGAVAVAGLGVDDRDDPLGGHRLGDAHASVAVVFDVLGGD